MRKYPIRLALLISGGGTTATAVITSTLRGKLVNLVRPHLVISSNPNAKGLERSLQAGMPREDVLSLNPADFPNAESFGEAILFECQKRSVELVGQYGWMVKTPQNVLHIFREKITNQHPGPLDPNFPDFGGAGMYGMRVHAARLFYCRTIKNDMWTEATAQRVHVEFDKGELLLVRQVKILPEDSPESLQERLLPVEHEVQIDVLEKFAHDEVKVHQRIIRLIPPEHEPILKEAKRVARLLYPKG